MADEPDAQWHYPGSRRKGTVKRVFEKRGYGLLRDEEGVQRFFALEEVEEGQRLLPGTAVLFEPRRGRKEPSAMEIIRYSGASNPMESDSATQNRREPEPCPDLCNGMSLHFGEGAGEKLYADIENAREEVKVVSPYLSVGPLKTLARLHRQGVRVTLVTSSAYESAIGFERDRREAGKLLVFQRFHTRPQRVRLKRIGLPLSVLVALAGLLLVLITFGSPASAPPEVLTLGLALLGLSVVAAIALSSLRAHHYTYESAFERLRVWDSRSPGSPTLQTKLYVIDGRVAYLGSANFTVPGLRHNHECLVEIWAPEEVRRLSHEIEALCSEDKKPFLTDLAILGRRVHGER